MPALRGGALGESILPERRRALRLLRRRARHALGFAASLAFATRNYLANVLERALQRWRASPRTSACATSSASSRSTRTCTPRRCTTPARRSAIPTARGRSRNEFRGLRPRILDYRGRHLPPGRRAGMSSGSFSTTRMGARGAGWPFALRAGRSRMPEYLEYVEPGGRRRATGERTTGRAALRLLGRPRAGRAGRHVSWNEAQAYCTGRAAAADGGRMGIRFLTHEWGERLGMDCEHLRTVSGLRRRSVRRLLAALVRHAQGVEGRELRHAGAGSAAAFRNFYVPERADIFAGFRTCKIKP